MERKDFRSITAKIKTECLYFGYGKITLDKDEENLRIDNHENSLADFSKNKLYSNAN